MGAWFPAIYDRAMKPLEKMRIEKIRVSIVSKAEGRVLEIGFGTGANFPHYKIGTKVDAIEPNAAMRKQAFEKLKKSSVPISTYSATAEDLPFPANTFDTVIATLVFCTIADPERALEEVRRVCKPEGKVLLFEHVRIERNIMGRIQDVLTPVWKKAFDGCHLNRNTLELVKRSGLRVTGVISYYGGFFIVIESLNE